MSLVAHMKCQSRTWKSHVAYTNEEPSLMFEYVAEEEKTHGPQMIEMRRRVMLHIWMSHDAHMNEPCHTWTIQVIYHIWCVKVTYHIWYVTNTTRRICDLHVHIWAMSNMDDSSHIYVTWRVVSHTCERIVTHRSAIEKSVSEWAQIWSCVDSKVMSCCCNSFVYREHHTVTHCNTLQHTATHCNTL